MRVWGRSARGADGIDRVQVNVQDTGIGISREDLARLASPFEQVESQHSKTQQGTGLGLALSKALIGLHGGTLEIQSEPGKGTTVISLSTSSRTVTRAARARHTQPSRPRGAHVFERAHGKQTSINRRQLHFPHGLSAVVRRDFQHDYQGN